MKPRTLIFAILSAVAINIAAADVPEPAYINNAEIVRDCIKIDAPDNRNWNAIYKSKSGIFKPFGQYCASFTLAPDGKNSDGAYLQFIVRRSDSMHPARDALAQNVPIQNTPTRISLNFTAPADPSKYAFQIHTRTGAKCKISDFKISEGTGAQFLGVKDTSAHSVALKIPTGAKEFAIESPRNVGGKIVDGAELEISPDAKNVVAKINAAIAFCKKSGAAKLSIPSGRYYITENTPISIDGMSDFEFDANGATFVYRKNRGDNFRITDSHRIAVRNIKIDWDWQNDPLASLAQVENIDASEGARFVDFKFFDRKQLYKKPVRIAMITPCAPDARRLGYRGSHGLLGVDQTTRPENYCKTLWLTPDTLRVFDNKGSMLSNLSRSAVVRIQHYYYDMTCFFMRSNTNLTLENIDVYSCAGHAFLCDGTQKFWQMKNVNIKPLSQNLSERPITTTADHLHFASSSGFFKMLDCEISFGADDCANFHDCTAYFKKSGARTLESVNMRQFDRFREGCEIGLLKSDMARTDFRAKVTKRVKLDGGKYTLTLDCDVSEGSEFVVYNTLFDTRNIIVRNCNFHDGSSNGLLVLARDVTIENCRFSNNLLCALKFLSGYTLGSWCEGIGVDNVVVRNCNFENSNPTMKLNNGFAADIFTGIYMRRDPSIEQADSGAISNILIENCKFGNINGLVAYIASARNFIMRNNIFNASAAVNPRLQYAGCIFARDSSGVFIEANTFGNSRADTGVYADTATVRDLVIKSNTSDYKK